MMSGKPISFATFSASAAVFNRFFRSRQRRHADLLRQRARRVFVAHQFAATPARGPTNVMPASCARLGKLRVLRQKSVAGMDEVHALFLRQRDDAGNVQIRADRPFAFADHIRFIRLEAMNGKPVFLRVNGDRAQAQFRRRAKDADGDFAAVGHEQFFGLCRGFKRWSFAQTHIVARLYKPAGRGWQRNDGDAIRG